MKTIFQIIKTAKEYNKAIDNLLAEHDVGKESTVYCTCVPKLYCDYISPSYAKDCLEGWKADGESYKDIVAKARRFVNDELNESMKKLAFIVEDGQIKEIDINELKKDI